MTKEAKIIIGIAAIAIIGFVAFAMAQPKVEQSAVSAPVDGTYLLREGSHMTGTKTAKVQVVEFGDYQCPACGAAHPAVKQLIADYKDNPKVNIVFRNFPLPMHQNALIGAEAAEAAGEQGKFWEMHDMLYEKQQEWSEAISPMKYFVTYATALGLDVEKFKTDVQGNKYSAIIKADQEDGQKLDITGTPSFFIGGSAFGAGTVPSYASMKVKIDELLK